jgi:hypothetical protein
MTVPFEPIRFSTSQPPELHVVVDTEEEFDWSAPFSRDAVSVTAIAELPRLQAVLEPYGVRPTYVIDYPVAATPASAAMLRELSSAGRCDVGAHLHPWVSPPYSEPLGPKTSYACNLGLDLELDKILRLKEAIVEHVGVTPRVYKAGRYGFGPTTAEALEALDFDVDASVNPRMDFTADGGPSFEHFRPEPAFFGKRRRLLELPCTTDYIGAARRIGPALHRAASAPALERFRAVGLLARSGALNKVMLSPEGNTLEEMRALTARLHADGVRTFALTLHSPSLKPGCTRYVASAGERDAFLGAIDRYCDYFFGALGGVASTPARLFDRLQRGSAT